MKGFVLGVVFTLVASMHGVRMTGMPTWDGILSDDTMWKIVAFVKHSDTLPPEAQATWQQAAASGGDAHAHGQGPPDAAGSH